MDTLSVSEEQKQFEEYAHKMRVSLTALKIVQRDIEQIEAEKMDYWQAWNILTFRMNDGICANMVRCGGYSEMIRPFYPTWAHYSGDPWYPVPAPRPLNSDADAMLIFISNNGYGETFFWEGEYGNLRKDFLKHLIMYLEQAVINFTEKTD